MARPGWYPDPGGQQGMFRYWDGSAWTHQLSPDPASGAPGKGTPGGGKNPAMIWAILVWTAAHVGTGAIMQLYCLARSVFGKLTPRYDADLQNVSLYWHFMALTVTVTVLVTAFLPRGL